MSNASEEMDDREDAWEGLSLEELGKAYAQAVGRTDDATGQSEESPENDVSGDSEPRLDLEETDIEAVAGLASIIEGALFIGHADGSPVQEAELAALMRDVTVDDVTQEIERLNEQYKQNDQAFRIIRDDEGVRLGVAADLEVVRRAFYGKIREATLSQGAIEVLSLVAYQPGITAEKVQAQRGKESASLISQLVRRRLLEQRRVPTEKGRKPIATYYPTERFLNLFNLESLEDLPQVEE